METLKSQILDDPTKTILIASIIELKQDEIQDEFDKVLEMKKKSLMIILVVIKENLINCWL